MNEANKQLVLQNKIANRAQWEKEIKAQDKQLENIRKIMDIFDEQRKLQTSSSKIMLANFELLKPSWKFETIQEYMENQRRLQELAQQSKEMEFDNIVQSRNADYEKIKVQRDELQKALDDLDKDIKELKGKGE
jgi:hypothetical protein